MSPSSPSPSPGSVPPFGRVLPIVLVALLPVGAASAGSAQAERPEGLHKALVGDPVGDARAGADLTGFSARHVDDALVLRLDLAATPIPADSGRADALYGFVDLDVDQDSRTGDVPAVDFLRLSTTGLGGDLLVDLGTYRAADGRADLVAAGGAVVERVPVTFGDRSVELEVPLVHAGGDGAVSAAAVVGDEGTFSDAAPDDGFLATADGGGEGVVLGGGRFAVDVSWRNASGQTGAGSLVFQSDDSAVFWFFQAGNWELMLKVVDACGLNDRFWVFAAGTTDVEFTVRVTDTVAGVVKSYRNPQGTAAPAVTDTDAFATCDAGGA